MPEIPEGPSPEQASTEAKVNLEALHAEAIKGEANLSNADSPEDGADTAQSRIERYRSYTGVCDVHTPEEAQYMVAELRKHRKDPEREGARRKIMIGVMTLRDILDGTESEDLSEIFPSRERLADGFIADPDVLNTIHYADLYGPEGRPLRSRESTDVLRYLELCVEYGGENLHAIQLDVTWPDPNDLKEFKDKYPDILIILQVGVFAFKEDDNDPRKVVDRLREYGESIDFALLDTSMGMGKGMDSASLLTQLRLIQSELPDLGLAVAGGLGPDSMDSLKQIAAEFPDIAIDAQGRLKQDDAPRDSLGHLIATTPPDPERTRKYIEQACDILDNY